MFKKSRRKIVAAIMAILVLLWVGTLCIIYSSSYYEVSNRNREMLDRYVELYILEQQPEDNSDNIFDGTRDNISDGTLDDPDSMPDIIFHDKKRGPELNNPHFENTPVFQLSTFYAVVFSKDGEILTINNTHTDVYENQELEEIAREIMDSGKSNGVKNSLVYRMADKGDYILVAFMDNTIIDESMTTLFRYTLIFGGLGIIALFFLAVYLAKRIVKPLEESYNKQKQFISDAGHELKTPVSVVSANAELLSRKIGENQWLTNIQYENQRMGKLVEKLLELARTEAVTPQMESVDFSRLVSGEALAFESVIFEKGMTFNCDITNNLYIIGNGTQIKQLTAILLDNAAGHCKQGKEITLTLKSEKNIAVLSVINYGDEIPIEQRKQIFERFYRVDSARNSEDKHYGLGLAIAKAIAVTHKGKIDVMCYDGKVEFTVHIPLQK